MLLLLLVAPFAGPVTYGQVDATHPPFECRWMDTPPVIDGRDDDAGWRDAAIVENFRQA